jgi:uridine kinase
MSPAPRPLLVAIVGGSGAGKTWLARKLETAFAPEAARISLDDFYRDRSHLPPARRQQVNFDHPRAIDWGALECALEDCLAGKIVRLPVYDFKSHCRFSRTQVLLPKRLLILDGLWLFRQRTLRRLFDWRIFIDCPFRTRRQRRLARDLRTRGRTRASVQRQFRDSVQPMHDRFVAPQRRWADVVLPGDFGRREVRQIVRQLRSRMIPISDGAS